MTKNMPWHTYIHTAYNFSCKLSDVLGSQIKNFTFVMLFDERIRYTVGEFCLKHCVIMHIFRTKYECTTWYEQTLRHGSIYEWMHHFIWS